MGKNHLFQKTLSLLLAAGTLAATALPVSAAQVTFTTLIEAKYEDADSFSEGLAAVKQGGKWGYIDETGKTVIPFRYDIAYPFSEGLAVVGKIEQRNVWHPTGQLDQWGNVEYAEGPADVYVWSVIDTNGRETTLTVPADDSGEQPAWDFCVTVDRQSYAPAYYNGCLNLDGYVDVEEPVNLVYDRQGKRMDFSRIADGAFTEGTFAACDPAEAGFYVLDRTGNVVLSSEDEPQAAAVRPFNQGLAPVLCYLEEYDFQGTWGFMDRSGKMVIAAKYRDFSVSDPQTEYRVFNDGIAAVQDQSGKWGGINKNGSTVIPFAYDALRVFREGLAVAKKDGKWGVIDTANRVVVPFEYDTLSGYSDGLCVAVRDGRTCLLDRYGVEVPGSDGAALSVFLPEDTVVVEQDGQYGFAAIEYTADLPRESEMDSWAYEEVVQAIGADLVPQHLQNQYKTNITRADFAALIVELITAKTGKTAEALVQEATGKTMAELRAAYPFTDANSDEILVANALGIINGKGNGVFDPYGLLTRQDAAVMLMRTGKYLGKTDVGESNSVFSDGAAIDGYAQEAVEYVDALGVMNGTSATTFSPKGNYTRQQAYITAYRLFTALQ